MDKLSHLDEQGKAKMVDITEKTDTIREAVACGQVLMKDKTLALIREGGIAKGGVLETARIAGIMGIKKTSELIPLCHPLVITGIDIDFEFIKNGIGIQVKVCNTGKTGVEMEALTGVSITALTIYDMCKAVDKGMVIEGIKLLKKTGGKSGDYVYQQS